MADRNRFFRCIPTMQECEGGGGEALIRGNTVLQIRVKNDP